MESFDSQYSKWAYFKIMLAYVIFLDQFLYLLYSFFTLANMFFTQPTSIKSSEGKDFYHTLRNYTGAIICFFGKGEN